MPLSWQPWKWTWCLLGEDGLTCAREWTNASGQLLTLIAAGIAVFFAFKQARAALDQARAALHQAELSQRQLALGLIEPVEVRLKAARVLLQRCDKTRSMLADFEARIAAFPIDTADTRNIWNGAKREIELLRDLEEKTSGQVEASSIAGNLAHAIEHFLEGAQGHEQSIFDQRAPDHPGRRLNLETEDIRQRGFDRRQRLQESSYEISEARRQAEQLVEVYSSGLKSLEEQIVARASTG